MSLPLRWTLAVSVLVVAALFWPRAPRGDLLEDLGSPWRPTAMEAATRIQAMGPEAWPVLRRGLSHPSPRVRARSLRFAAVIGEQVDADAIAACLRDPEQDVRIQAAMALKSARGWSDPTPLIETLADKKQPDNLRVDLIEALGKRRTQEATAAVVRILNDHRESVHLRAAAAGTLGCIGGPPEAALLSRTILSRGEPLRVRRSAASALGCRPASPESATLLKVLKDPTQDGRTRSVAITSLGRQGYRPAAPFLTEIAADEKTPLLVRVNAATALGRMGIEVPHAFAAAALTDRDEHVRRSAADLVAVLRDQDLAGDVDRAMAREADCETRCDLERAARLLKAQRDAEFSEGEE
ncbi:MAG: hypothetical protein FJX76_05430 [Armatimonadetes bacterium]|nr:hypothetical protein [Armatimonadota bacterium]